MLACLLFAKASIFVRQIAASSIFIQLLNYITFFNKTKSLFRIKAPVQNFEANFAQYGL
jgi:hypothetical protein